MTPIAGGFCGMLVGGLLAYGALRLLWPALPASDFTNLIGLAALLGAALGAAIAKRRSAPKGTIDAKGHADEHKS